jgi:hypothetical protein
MAMELGQAEPWTGRSNDCRWQIRSPRVESERYGLPGQASIWVKCRLPPASGPGRRLVPRSIRPFHPRRRRQAEGTGGSWDGRKPTVGVERSSIAAATSVEPRSVGSHGLL